MKEKKEIKISLTGVLLIIALVIIVIMSYFMYKLYNDRTTERNTVGELDNQVSNLESTQKIAEGKINNDNNIILYYGLDITNSDMELSIKNTTENKEKYEIKYYNYENGEYLGESQGKLEETYEGYAQVSNTEKIAISQKYDAVPRKYQNIEEIPSKLMEFADCNKVEIQSIDLDGDSKLEYVMAYGTFASPEDYDVEKYSNYSEILVFDNDFNKIDTLVKAENQFWEHEGKVTDEFFCSLDDVEYIDIDKDGIMEILVDTNVYEGIGVNVYKYENGKISGDTNCTIYALP